MVAKGFADLRVVRYLSRILKLETGFFVYLRRICLVGSPSKTAPDLHQMNTPPRAYHFASTHILGLASDPSSIPSNQAFCMSYTWHTWREVIRSPRQNRYANLAVFHQQHRNRPATPYRFSFMAIHPPARGPTQTRLPRRLICHIRKARP